MLGHSNVRDDQEKERSTENEVEIMEIAASIG